MKTKEKKQRPNQKQLIEYTKNEHYDIKQFNQWFDVWKCARSIGDELRAQEMMGFMCQYCEKFIMKELQERYKVWMENPQHKEDFVQDIWKEFLEILPKYDYDKSGITTYIVMWIRHVGTEYYSKNITHVSGYYSDKMTKIDKALDSLQKSMNEFSIEELAEIVDIPKTTVKRVQDYMIYRNQISYENLLEKGYGEASSFLMQPEEVVLREEREQYLYHIIEHDLSEEQKKVLQLYVNPDNEKRKYASLSEITRKMNEEIENGNIPQKKYTCYRVKKMLNDIFETINCR